MQYVVILEVSKQRPYAIGVFSDLASAKKMVFEQEHLYDDEDVLVPDVRDVTWEEDGDELVADSLDSTCTYIISGVKVDA